MLRKILNSKAYKVVDFIVRLMLLNILLILISSSLFIIITTFIDDLKFYWYYILLIPTALTIYPCIVATTDVIKSYIIDKNTGLIKDFFKAFGKYYLKSLLISIILIVVIVLFRNSYVYFDTYKYDAPINMVGYILTISFSLILIFAFIHLSMVIVYFKEINIIHAVKLSLIISFKELGITFILLLITVASIVLSYFFQIYLILFSFSLVIYFYVLLTKKIYIKLSQTNQGESNENKN